MNISLRHRRESILRQQINIQYKFIDGRDKFQLIGLVRKRKGLEVKLLSVAQIQNATSNRSFTTQFMTIRILDIMECTQYFYHRYTRGGSAKCPNYILLTPLGGVGANFRNYKSNFGKNFYIKAINYWRAEKI